MKMRCMIMPIQTCQNCVLGLQWNMNIKCKVENKKNKKKKESNQTNKQKTRNDWQIKDMN